jgi:hypothetical protein
MAKKVDRILVEVNGGLVISVEVDSKLASRMTDLKTAPAQQEMRGHDEHC